MSGPSREPALPLPGLATVVVGAAGLLGGWLAWRAGAPERARDETARRKEAIADPDLRLQERLQSVNAWVAEGRAGVPRLIRYLANPDPDVRDAVLLAFSRLGPEAQEAVPAVAALLDDARPGIRAHAIVALRNIGEREEQLAAWIVPRLDDADEVVRDEAVNAVGQCGPAAVDELLGRLDGLGIDGRLLAVRLLQQMGSHSPRATAAVRGLLASDPAAAVRDQAFMALVTLSPLELEEILAGLHSHQPQVIDVAIGLVQLAGPEALPALPRLLELLAVEAHRSGALRAMGSIGPAAADAVPRVREWLRMDDGLVNRDAIHCLARIGIHDPCVDATIVSLFHDSEPWNVRRAAEALRIVDPEGAQAEAPRLVARLASGDPAVVRRASVALVALGPQAAGSVRALIETVKAGNEPARQAAVEVLSTIGPPARAALPVLVQELQNLPRAQSADGTRARTLLRAIRELACAAPALERPLLRWIDRELDRIRRTSDGDWIPVEPLRDAALALGRVAPDSLLAHRALCRIHDTASTSFSDNRYTYLCNAALWGMVDAGACPGETASLLLDAVRLDDPATPNVVALRGLGFLPEQAGRFVPLLIEALAHRDFQTRTAAALALGRLGPRSAAAIPTLQAIRDEPANQVKNVLRPVFSFGSLTLELDPVDDPILEYRRQLGLMSLADAAEIALHEITGSQDAVRFAGAPSLPGSPDPPGRPR